MPRPSTLHAKAYLGFEAIESEKVLKRAWHYIGPSRDFVRPEWCVPVEVLGQPIIVVCDKAERLSAFYNVCQHRAGPLATEPVKARQIQCRYHGWCYDLKGKLTHATQMPSPPENVHLKSVHVATFEGLVFVALESPQLTLEALFEGIKERIKPHDLSALQFHTTQSYDIRCNWKVYVDNFLEGYHVPFIHPALNRSLSATAYVTEIIKHQSLQHAPFTSNDEIYSQRSSNGPAHAYYYFLFPNLMLNILPDRLQINQVIPRGLDRCRVDFHYFYGGNLHGLSEFIARDQAFSDEVQKEDIEVCEHLQRAMNTGAYTSGTYHPEQETALIHFHDQLRSLYGD